MTFDKRTKRYSRYQRTLKGAILPLYAILFVMWGGIANATAPTVKQHDPRGETLPETLVLPEASGETQGLSVEDKIMAAFGPVVGPEAVKVAFCESSLNPYASHTNSSATGLFQIIKGTWNGYKCTGSRTDADDNISCAYKIYQNNGWGANASWGASKGCHGLD